MAPLTSATWTIVVSRRRPVMAPDEPTLAIPESLVSRRTRASGSVVPFAWTLTGSGTVAPIVTNTGSAGRTKTMWGVDGSLGRKHVVSSPRSGARRAVRRRRGATAKSTAILTMERRPPRAVHERAGQVVA